MKESVQKDGLPEYPLQSAPSQREVFMCMQPPALLLVTLLLWTYFPDMNVVRDGQQIGVSTK